MDNSVWVSQDRLDELDSRIRNMQIYGAEIAHYGAGPGAGMSIVFPPQSTPASVKLVPVRITGGNNLSGYIVDVYGNGLAQQPTYGVGMLYIVGLSLVTAIPAVTLLYVMESQIQAVGGAS